MGKRYGDWVTTDHVVIQHQSGAPLAAHYQTTTLLNTSAQPKRDTLIHQPTFPLMLLQHAL